MSKLVALNQQTAQMGSATRLRTDEGITAFTDRGIESLQEFLADVRTWEGSIRGFLEDSQCDPEIIERIMADQPKP